MSFLTSSASLPDEADLGIGHIFSVLFHAGCAAHLLESTSLHHRHQIIPLRNMTDGLPDAAELKANLAALAGQRRLRPSGWQIELQVVGQGHIVSPSSATLSMVDP
jgi:hypothetical protein